MTETVQEFDRPESLEALLRAGLDESAATAETVVPILRHVLASRDDSLFGDELVARIRGMLRHLAVQLLDGQDGPGTASFVDEIEPGRIDQLADALIGHASLVAHLHALAIEHQLLERAHSRLGVDIVLTPMVQKLVASPEPDVAVMAMRFVAAQARHNQAMRRMKLPLLELPGDFLHMALLALQSVEDAESSAVQARIRTRYDESATRLGMASRLIASMGANGIEALSIRHSGVALFITALSIGSEVDRDVAALMTHESQAVRLALALRASGVKGDLVQDMCLSLHPEIDFPEDFARIDADLAAGMLAAAGLSGA